MREPWTWQKTLSVGGLILSWIIIGYLIFYLVYGDSGFPANRQMQAEINRLKEENKKLQLDNQRLFHEIEYRRTDSYLEELSRLELRNMRSDEKMIILSEK